MEEPHLGFKTVTIKNIFETDPVVATMVSLKHATGEVKAQEYGDWVRMVTAIELDARVPLEVRKAFMFSRGALCYAHWYYPALTLGMNDMLRAADFSPSLANFAHANQMPESRLHCQIRRRTGDASRPSAMRSACYRSGLIWFIRMAPSSA